MLCRTLIPHNPITQAKATDDETRKRIAEAVKLAVAGPNELVQEVRPCCHSPFQGGKVFDACVDGAGYTVAAFFTTTSLL